MSSLIRPIRNQDCPEVADLWYQSWLSTGAEHGESVTPAVLERRLWDEPWDIWVAELDQSIVAFLAIDRQECCLSQLFVAPEFQNRGIGLNLMEKAQSEMPQGFWLRTDEANLRARRFYQRHGLKLDRLEEQRAYYSWRT